MIREYPDRPIVGVGVVVWQQDRVLLIQRGKAPRIGQWSLPGGVQELGETVAATAIREVREETGIEIGALQLIDVVDSIQRQADGRVLYHYTLVDLWAEWRAGEARAGDDAAALAWVRPDALDHYALWPETIRIIGLAAVRRSAVKGAENAVKPELSGL